MFCVGKDNVKPRYPRPSTNSPPVSLLGLPLLAGNILRLRTDPQINGGAAGNEAGRLTEAEIMATRMLTTHSGCPGARPSGSSAQAKSESVEQRRLS
jgi:hypothetical protein